MTDRQGRAAGEGPLLAGSVGLFYALWTLLPNSNSWMVGWPWVVLWQAAVLMPVVWLLWQGWFLPSRSLSLGRGWNLWCGFTLLVLVLSSWQAEFPVQARWYSSAAVGAVATLYGLKGWLNCGTDASHAWNRDRLNGLLRFQTLLVIVFSLLSLGLWLSQTYLPELARLQALSEYGIQRGFNFNILSLRNWYPIGHQNYVAGFLVINLPLLAGWGWSQRGRWRWLAWGGAGLGLMVLYTTGSRAGGLGLGVTVLTALLLLGIHQRPQPWQWLLGSGVGLVSLLALGFTNDRLRTSVSAILQGNLSQGELAYRWITLVTGWTMGMAQPWTGLGLGSVPLAYQRYRPGWAGREAELIHQLHNTPIQLWAELGLGGLGLGVGAIALWGWTTYRVWQQTQVPRALLIGLTSGLVGYGAVALTDYQLDNIAITGSLLIELSLLITFAQFPPRTPQAHPSSRRWQRRWVRVGLGGLLTFLVTLVPFYRAWSLAHQGFVALAEDDRVGFVDNLERAHQIAPWQPYYSYQLGWNLGNFSFADSLPEEQRRRLQGAAIAWFEAAISQSPHLEFGYSSLGWLQGDVEPVASAIAFTEAAQLVPAKAGVFFGLAIQFLRLNQPEQAIQAFVLEIARHPLYLTSPFWQQPGFQRFYPQVLDGVEALYSEWLRDLPPAVPLYYQARRVRGGLQWWRGDWSGAAADWQAINDALGLALVAEAQGVLAEPVGGSGGLALQAWQQPDQRRTLLAQAWAQSPQDNDNLAASLPPAALIDVLVAEMDRAETFQQWLQSPALARPNRYERLGFGVLSRQIDGPQPVDYWIRIEHLAMDRFFTSLFPSPSFMPELDQRLAPLRARLIEQVQALVKP